ncbi:MAG: hypothetical protein HKN63_06460 [Rhodobacteraceae bacterium]|nr:hypothetical protein [Paracoccaceae bacterium]
MTLQYSDLYAPDEMGYEDEFDYSQDDLGDEYDEFEGGFGDDFDLLDDMPDDIDDLDWSRLLNTVATAGEAAYGNYVPKTWSKKNRVLDSVLRGALGAVKGASKSWYQESGDDPFEPEYETASIDAMEEMTEDALAASPEERAMAADEMVRRSFGIARAPGRLRPIMAVLRRRVYALMMRARRNPQMRSLARLAPLAMRRTAAILVRMTMARRPVSPGTAMRIFNSILARLVRSHQMRARALKLAKLRAMRSRRRSGGNRRAGYQPRYPASYSRHPRHMRYGAGYGY